MRRGLVDQNSISHLVAEKVMQSMTDRSLTAGVCGIGNTVHQARSYHSSTSNTVWLII